MTLQPPPLAVCKRKQNSTPRTTASPFCLGTATVVGKNDWPRYTEEEPEIYEQEELDALFKACDDQERLWFEFFPDDGDERARSYVHVLV
jgi:hypothetical protein